MSAIRSTLACNLDPDILAASLPLFNESVVDAIEWSFDTVLEPNSIPDWFQGLLNAYRDQGRLIGHGVFYSLFSGAWSPTQQDWLENLSRLTNEYRFDHVTEHFGYMTGKDFHSGAPLSVPFNETTLRLGRDRIARIVEVTERPFGLENLAFAYAREDVQEHGHFLFQLLEPVNGFIVFDLHNFYCHQHNFEIDAKELLALYDLSLVREIHISGGSWATTEFDPTRSIRRDTHDDRVPDEVFALLEHVLPQCRNLKYVVLEQLGVGLKTAEQQEQYQQDFYRMKRIVTQQNAASLDPDNDFHPTQVVTLSEPATDASLAEQQESLSCILASAADWRQAMSMIRTSTLADSDWEVEKWAPEMLETAIAVTQKWKKAAD